MMKVTVVGSVNLDLTAHAARLPVAGETITGAVLTRAPGGKGANQALAARRLGADVTLLACVGDDSTADEALRLLRAEGVDLSGLSVVAGKPTGVALIVVAADGENQIVVAPGANHHFRPEDIHLPEADAVMCQLEVPFEVVERVAATAAGFFCLNAAPVRPMSDSVLARCDLLVVNEVEHRAFESQLHLVRGYVALTLGSQGAVLERGGQVVARAVPPRVEVVDSVGAGDCFVAALVVSILEGRDPTDALQRAVDAGALATTGKGAQPPMPTAAAVDQVDRGRRRV
jgi:ribokinase